MFSIFIISFYKVRSFFYFLLFLCCKSSLEIFLVLKMIKPYMTYGNLDGINFNSVIDFSRYFYIASILLVLFHNKFFDTILIFLYKKFQYLF